MYIADQPYAIQAEVSCIVKIVVASIYVCINIQISSYCFDEISEFEKGVTAIRLTSGLFLILGLD